MIIQDSIRQTHTWKREVFVTNLWAAALTNLSSSFGCNVFYSALFFPSTRYRGVGKWCNMARNIAGLQAILPKRDRFLLQQSCIQPITWCGVTRDSIARAQMTLRAILQVIIAEVGSFST